MHKQKSKFLLLLFVPLLVGTWFMAYSLASGPLIPDENLEKAIRVAINYEKGEIRADQLSDIQELNIRDSQIENLEGIQYLTSVVSLDLRDNQISDISLLSSLINLHELNLRGNQIHNIDAISNLTLLRELNIRDNQIIDLSPLSNLHQLRDLNMRNNQITTIEPLRHLENLRDRLYLEGNPINDFSPILDFLDEINQTDIDTTVVDSSLLPIFSHVGGFYDDFFELEILSPIENGLIYYTLDGSEPNPIYNSENTHLYTNPIAISERDSEPSVYAFIPTNRIDDHRGWKAPTEPITKATLVRAIIHSDDEPISSVATHSYFFTPYSLPVVSISTNPENLFDDEIGIYVPGVNYQAGNDGTGNYFQRGSDWERPIHLEYFELDGTLALSQDAGIRIHGNFSRRFPQKSLRLYSRSEYGKSRFNYQFFDDKPIDDFNRLILRHPGNDWGVTMFRDDALQRVLHHLDLATQHYQPTVVFLNGEYWGIHNLRDRLDKHYFETHFGGNRDQYTILENNARLTEGSEMGKQDYEDMIEYVKTHDIAEDIHYEYLQSLMDIDNYTQYYISQIYIANVDWPQNNIRYWRYEKTPDEDIVTPELDGRWRWLVFDLDRTFVGRESYNHNTIEWATSLTNQKNDQEWPNVLFRSLLENKSYKTKFLNEFADHLNSSFQTERVHTIFNDIKTSIQPEMDEHINRWGIPASIEEWNKSVDKMFEFATNRPSIVRQHLVEHFELSGTANLSIKMDTSKGTVIVNSIEISSETLGISNPDNWTGTYFKDIPVTITALPKDGYSFKGWGPSIKESSVTIEVNLTEDFALEAIFE
ncbi:CotH kinase family protein [Bacillus alkalicellulosilyticus]|uniref:CotH kinase family protein n=1 Tax=Alkalihalobacterium alkalicellulosilyticum TaxID=1912214 RepID=UPI0009971794|nr:CotH kinase family protein [Bacillus alkalicellulosilyticus]